MRYLILILFFLCQLISAKAQNNCNKFPLKQIYIITNPSFEALDTIPCPSSYVHTYLSALPGWIEPTKRLPVGFLNSCSNYSIPQNVITDYQIANPFLSYAALYPIVPQPIPDGNSLVGLNDMAIHGIGQDTLSYKSYIATCLQQPLLKDSLYILSFYIGFGKRAHNLSNQTSITITPNHDTIISVVSNDVFPPYSPSPETFALFGLPDCASIPSVIPSVRTCLSTVGWSQLGSSTVSSDTGTWIKTTIQFRPTENIGVIALGPSCDIKYQELTDTITYRGQPDGGNYSYFLDNLQLYQSTVAMPFVNITGGSVCNKAVTLSLQSTDASLSAASFQWYKNGGLLNRENKKSITVTLNNYGEGYYQCRAQSDSFCLLSDSFQVAWSVTPDPNILGKDSTACNGDTAFLNAYTDATATYKWQDGSTNSFLKAAQSGLYKVTISNSCGIVQSSKKINFEQCSADIYVPSAFTPNGDGLNDIFRAKYFQVPISFNMKIYNRFGQVVFSTTNPSQGWDGAINSFIQPNGTYVWFIDYINHNNVHALKKGTVTLIR